MPGNSPRAMHGPAGLCAPADVFHKSFHVLNEARRENFREAKEPIQGSVFACNQFRDGTAVERIGFTRQSLTRSASGWAEALAALREVYESGFGDD